MVSPFDSPDPWNAHSGEKSRSLPFSDTVTPNKTKCPISVVAESPPRTRKWLHSSVHVIQRVLQGVSTLLSHRAPVFLASSLGMWGRI